MRVRDLGPLLVDDNGREQPVVGTKGSAMLALLTIHVNQQVSADALIAAAWGERVTAGAASTLLSHIWRLRRLLEPHRRSGQPPQILINDAGGYRLVGSASTVDSLFLSESSTLVRDQMSTGHLQEALCGADAALSRWRGRPYGPAADEDWARPAVARLDELRVQLQERRIAALLGLGALDTALSDLRPLIAALPFHETLRGLQMEALHRAGRTEQALEAFQDTRRTLIDEIGIEPGRDLQLLHRRILDDDPSLSGPCTVAPTKPPAPIAPQPPASTQSADRPPLGVHLPPTMTPLVGRNADLTQLEALVREHRLVTLTGTAGCGKTRLAVQVALEVADAFDDGVWFIDLVGVNDPTLVVDVIISTIGFVPSSEATPREELSNYLSARRVLVVLDNCEHLLDSVTGIVQEVLGHPRGVSGCHILATSRERLSVAGEIGWTVPPLGLPGPEDDAPPTDAAAVQLLLQRLRAANPSIELDERSTADVVRICFALDGLPLPLELAAARAPAFSLAEISQQVMDHPGRLRRFGQTGSDHRTTLHSTIDWSYQLLSPDERAAHRQLSVLPGPFSEAAAAAVLGVAPREAEDVLIELVHRSMLAPLGSVVPGRPTTFRQLVTVRSHARDALSGADRGAAEKLRDGFTARLLQDRPPLGSAGEADWNDRLDDDYATVRATLAHNLIAQPTPAGGLLTSRLPFYWYYRGKIAEGTRWLTLSHDLLLDADPHDLAVTRLGMSAALVLQGRLQQARPYADAASAFTPDVGDPRIEAMGEQLIGLIGAAWITDHQPVVVEMHQHLMKLMEGTDSAHLRLLVDAVGTNALAAAGQLEAAMAQSSVVLQRACAEQVPMAIWLASGAPMAYALYTRQPEIGIPWVERCIAAHLPFGTGAEGAFIETRGNFAAQQGDYPLAARLYGAAHSTIRRVGMQGPWRHRTSELIDQTRSQLDDRDFDHLWRAGQALSPRQVLEGLRAGWTH